MRARSADPNKLPPETVAARALALLEPDRRPAAPLIQGGWLEMIGQEDPTGSHPGQRLMISSLLPQIYERLWRPLGARLLMGAAGPDTQEEHRIAMDMLALSPGDIVLDLACGPGNFTRSFAEAVGEGLVVGVDASRTMLTRAVSDTRAANVAYMRGDACALPFADDAFDAVCCFAALYLIEEPISALEEIVRVLAPGGRLALLSSCHRGPLPAGAADAVVRRLTGVRIFARDELTEALRARGILEIEQRVSGLAQFVSGRKPGASPRHAGPAPRA
jgi:ubiquinone/menaquinone biosynthesis C-methylase UbiE